LSYTFLASGLACSISTMAYTCLNGIELVMLT